MPNPYDPSDQEITQRYRIPVEAIIQEGLSEENTRETGAYPRIVFDDSPTEEQLVIFF